MAGAIRRIYTSDVWLNGTALVGKAKEVNLPEIEFEVDEDARIGLFGIAPAIAGIQALECTVTFDSWDEIWAKSIANWRKRIDLQFRGALEDVAASQVEDPVSYVITVGGIVMKKPIGSFSPQEAGEWEIGISADYIRQVVDGKEILKYNARTNEYVVDSTDLLAGVRGALGL